MLFCSVNLPENQNTMSSLYQVAVTDPQPVLVQRHSFWEICWVVLSRQRFPDFRNSNILLLRVSFCYFGNLTNFIDNPSVNCYGWSSNDLPDASWTLFTPRYLTQRNPVSLPQTSSTNLPPPTAIPIPHTLSSTLKLPVNGTNSTCSSPLNLPSKMSLVSGYIVMCERESRGWRLIGEQWDPRVRKWVCFVLWVRVGWPGSLWQFNIVSVLVLFISISICQYLQRWEFDPKRSPPQKMRFETHLRKDRIKPLQPILSMILSFLKSRPSENPVHFIYVSSQHEFRILIQNDNTPIVLVLETEPIASKLISVSKSETTNSSIGFMFKNGISFLEHLFGVVREAGDGVGTDQDRVVVVKIAKDKEFRTLEFRVKGNLIREEIQKPNKNENELFTYQWIDGVSHSEVCIQLNPTIIVQMLKVATKVRNHYMVQILQQKKLLLTLDTENSQLSLSLKSPTSPIHYRGKLTKIEGKHGKYTYQIKIQDAEQLALAIKSECMFVIDQDRVLSVSYTNLFYNCQICLKGLVGFLGFEGQGLGQGQGQGGEGVLKRQM